MKRQSTPSIVTGLASDRLVRQGMTLLEVLVAMGILVAGLASVASLMPAAGARLVDATVADRAGTLSANAMADLHNRDFFKVGDLFPQASIKVAVVGDAFKDDPAKANEPFDLASFRRLGSGALGLTEATFLLRDDLQVVGDTTTLTINDGGPCYGATIVPVTISQPVVQGSQVRLSVAVFKKPNVESQTITLKAEGSGTGLFEVLPSPGTTAEATRKRFLPSCSWAFAVDEAFAQAPRWLHIGSSFSTSTAATPTVVKSFVCFSNATLATELTVSGSITVYAFPRLLRVDERTVTLK